MEEKILKLLESPLEEDRILAAHLLMALSRAKLADFFKKRGNDNFRECLGGKWYKWEGQTSNLKIFQSRKHHLVVGGFGIAAYPGRQAKDYGTSNIEIIDYAKKT